MPLTTVTKASLINGVSQQAAPLRLPSQVHLQENALSSIADGNKNRPPTVFKKKLTTSNWDSAKIHTINRSADEQFVVVVTDGSLAVYDLDGNAVTVTEVGSAFDYLDVTGDPKEQIKLLTIADTTFVVNRETDVAMDSATSAGPQSIGLVWVKQAVQPHDYQVLIDGTQEGAYTSGASDTASDIASALETDLNTNLGAGWTIARFENVISIVKDDNSAFDLDVGDTYGNNAIKALKDSVQDASDLPSKAYDGIKLQVVSDAESGNAAYWLEFVGTGSVTIGDGTWVETVAPNIEYQLDAETMPHVLVRTATGFDFKEYTWEDRNVGDATSNPDPSFVGTNINNVFLHRNRLGFLADNKVIMSENNALTNFFRTTVVSLLDGDPIDVSASGEADDLRWTLEYQGQLILSSTQRQFLVDVEDLLTPKTIRIERITKFESIPGANTVGAGPVAFFSIPLGSYSGVREFFLTQLAEVNDAAHITKHIPRYIEGVVTHLTVATNEDLMVVQSDGDLTKLYVYQWLWQGNNKVQSAWHTWTFDGDVLACEFFADVLYMVKKHDDGVYLESINVADDSDSGSSVLTRLDRRLADDTSGVSMVYSSGTDTTAITIPYEVEGDIRVVAASGGTLPEGQLLDQSGDPTGTTTVTVLGDVTSEPLWIGVPFTWKVVPTEPYQVIADDRGNPVARRSGRFHLAEAIVGLENTGYVLATVTSPSGHSYQYTHTGSIVGQAGSLIGSAPTPDATFRIPIRLPNTQHTLTLESDSHLPVRVSSIDYRTRFSDISR